MIQGFLTLKSTRNGYGSRMEMDDDQFAIYKANNAGKVKWYQIKTDRKTKQTKRTEHWTDIAEIADIDITTDTAQAFEDGGYLPEE